VAAAKAKDYSVALLRLSLAAYRLARSIGIDGVYSRCIVATRGRHYCGLWVCYL
jgi:hypothetical protein